MSLIADIKKLRELEQQGDQSTLGWKMLDLAPAMLSVLECFREGDAETLHLMKEILSHVKEDNIISIRLKHGQDISDYVDCLARSERAASLMEQEREG